MIYIIPITGDATCGKTYLCEKIKDFFVHNNQHNQDAIYIDTSSMAKNLFKSCMTDNATSTSTLSSAVLFKNERYRRALNLIIQAFDLLDIRLKRTISDIDNAITQSIQTDLYTDIFVFVNVRELYFINKLLCYCKMYDYKFKILLMHDESVSGKSSLAVDDYDSIFRKLKTEEVYSELSDSTLVIKNTKSMVYNDSCISSIIEAIKAPQKTLQVFTQINTDTLGKGTLLHD